ncbi:type II secretion system F family protein [Variovorax sp. Sphag1AA]|uniref:type II secretion system F family protein n=1 Tax=Variovorax sp. Sphag1AA TaxID=2587027 RepID=UPI001803BBC2|nr:type II secretion system F family protein [Variovorax sp. Sphag1AA]MBB3176023.1 general secretion pathway protein F [Variovorax sp. Sphag1AA]
MLEIDSTGVPIDGNAGSRADGRPAVGSGRFDLLLFSQELHSLLQAGLNLGEALGTLMEKSQGATRTLLAAVHAGLRQGKNFSDVLEAHSIQFPPVFVATVRSSERTGNLPEAIERYVAYQLQFDALRKKLVAAAIYPALLIAVGCFVTLFLLGYVVPRFAAVYESSGREMPWASGLLLGLGHLIDRHAVIVLSLLAGAFAAVVWQFRQPSTRQRLLERLLRLPGLAPRADLFRLSRFYRALSLLLSAGIALPRAMGMVDGLLGAGQRSSLAGARERIEQGGSVSQALVQFGLATPVAKSLVQVGERSGQLSTMFERAARFHDEEMARWIDATTKLLEPVLMLLIGLVIGLVVVLMYMPIFELAGSLQ